MNEIKPLTGITIMNKAGKLVLWVRVKEPTHEPPFVLFGYWPEKADDDAMREKMELAVELVKLLAAEYGLPMYDFHAEIEPQLDQYLAEAGGNVPDHPTQDDIELEVTDVVTGQKSRLVWGISKGEMKKASST